MNLKYVTLTGADENTNVDDLVKLSNNHPKVEWAFLHSINGNATKPRYPSLGWIANAIAQLEDHNIAIHICGSLVNEYVYGIRDLAWLSKINNPYNIRVQLNIPSYIDVSVEHFIVNFSRMLEKNSLIQFIVQHNNRNANSVINMLNHIKMAQIKNIQVLRDCSGGRGIRESGWSLPENLPRFIPYGFAGGIGPDTVLEDIAALKDLVGQSHIWIDMESSLREKAKTCDSIFSIPTCTDILEKIQNCDV